jgi:hypothetical protein
LLPLIGNGQSASLRAAKGVPIIPELLRELHSCGADRFQGLYLQALSAEVVFTSLKLEALRKTSWTSSKKSARSWTRS